MGNTIGPIVRDFIVRQAGPEMVGEEGETSFVEVEPFVDNLAEAARESGDAVELRGYSTELKTRFLLSLEDAPDYSPRDLVQENLLLLKKITRQTQDLEAAKPEVERLRNLYGLAVEQIAEQADGMARQTIAMGLAAGAVDAVVVAVLNGESGKAPQSVKPPIAKDSIERYVQPLYSEPDKAVQRLDFIKTSGTERLPEVIEHHVVNSDEVAMHMTSPHLSPDAFSRLKLNLFAHAYHVGLTLALQNLPEAVALAPKWDEGPAKDMKVGADEAVIGDIPLDINW